MVPDHLQNELKRQEHEQEQEQEEEPEPRIDLDSGRGGVDQRDEAESGDREQQIGHDCEEHVERNLRRFPAPQQLEHAILQFVHVGPREGLSFRPEEALSVPPELPLSPCLEEAL